MEINKLNRIMLISLLIIISTAMLVWAFGSYLPSPVDLEPGSILEQWYAPKNVLLLMFTAFILDVVAYSIYQWHIPNMDKNNHS